jgi:tRNA-dihydrouridine synthase
VTFLDNLPKPIFILAPMDDVTDTVFRQIITDLAAPDLFFTEFVNVDGLQSPGREKLIKKLQFTPKEKPIFAQLWGLKPENFYKTTKEVIDMGFDGVDINMGCPVKTVIKNGACAALINNRELAGEIIDAVREACLPAGRRRERFPISIKTRVGFSTTDMSWLEFLLSKKLDLLSIHGRTAKQLSKIPADWELIGNARQMRDSLVPCLPSGRPATLIVGNGDVMSRQQAEKIAKKYKLDGVMIGRGIFQDPFVFAQKSPWGDWSKEQKTELFKKHIELFSKTWKRGEYKFETLKKFAKVYINGFDGASELRTKLMSTTSTDEALQLL